METPERALSGKRICNIDQEQKLRICNLATAASSKWRSSETQVDFKRRSAQTLSAVNTDSKNTAVWEKQHNRPVPIQMPLKTYMQSSTISRASKKKRFRRNSVAEKAKSLLFVLFSPNSSHSWRYLSVMVVPCCRHRASRGSAMNCSVISVSMRAPFESRIFSISRTWRKMRTHMQDLRTGMPYPKQTWLKVILPLSTINFCSN